MSFLLMEKDLLKLLATAVGSWGLSAQTPRIFQRMSESEVTKFVALYILILQGAAGFNTRKAAVGAVSATALRLGLDMLVPQKNPAFARDRRE